MENFLGCSVVQAMTCTGSVNHWQGKDVALLEQGPLLVHPFGKQFGVQTEHGLPCGDFLFAVNFGSQQNLVPNSHAKLISFFNCVTAKIETAINDLILLCI